MAGDVVHAGVATALEEADLAGDRPRQAVAVGHVRRIDVGARDRADAAHGHGPGAGLARCAGGDGVAEHRQRDRRSVADAIGIGQHQRHGVRVDRRLHRHPGDVAADGEALFGDRADRREVDRERHRCRALDQQRVGVEGAQCVDGRAEVVAQPGGLGHRGVGVDVPGARLPGQAPGHVGRSALEDVRDLRRGQVRVRLQHQRDDAGHVRRRHRRAAHVRVVRQVGRIQRFRVVLRLQRRQRAEQVAGGDDVHAGRDHGGFVEVGPLLAVRSGEAAAFAALAARRERGEDGVLLACADGDHPRRLRVGIVRVLARAVVARREHADDAALVQLVAGDVHRVQRVELARGTPGIADHADRRVVAELVGRRVIEAADRIQDQQHRAGPVADQVGARGDATVQAVGHRPRAADGAGAVGAMARAPVRVGDAFQVGDRQHRVDRGQVGDALRVLDDMVAELQVRMGRIDAGIVDHDGHAGAAERDRAAEVVRVLHRARGAGKLPGFLVEVLERGVEPDRSDFVAVGKRADLRRRGQRARDRQGAHGDAAIDAQLLEDRPLLAGDRAGLLVADDHLQLVGRVGGRQLLHQLRVQVGLGQGQAAGEHAGGDGGQAQADATGGWAMGRRHWDLRWVGWARIRGRERDGPSIGTGPPQRPSGRPTSGAGG